MSATLMDLEPARRDAVLNAALDEFVARGYAAASTNAIARRAGMSKALMFHYVGSKRELFLLVHGFFHDLMGREYLDRMDGGERDLVERLRRSFLLQASLVVRHPSILAIDALSVPTGDEALDAELARLDATRPPCSLPLFDDVDETLFRSDVDPAVCKRLVRRAAEGFASHLLDRAGADVGLDAKRAVREIEAFADDLRLAFYHPCAGRTPHVAR